MGSHKRSAQEKQRAQFAEQLSAGGLDDIFAREERRRDELSREKEAALRYKACESKNRYVTKQDAEAAIIACAEHGTTGLHCYRCSYCNGWHLTSKDY